ncbi:hypothetical protein D1BOALGB6SA_3693, partial [Olavius sp. associated proteobacterium Delta 1]
SNRYRSFLQRRICDLAQNRLVSILKQVTMATMIRLRRIKTH